ncbi:MAG: hypothetical protein IT559_00040 [Alphaproteobacteria bacterium]|nr:hypothetical protein [Alphaproteobacteria bacterium]
MRIFFLSLLLITLCCTGARAAMNISEQEKAVFSFFKLAKTDPDYSKWITQTARYKNAPDFLKESVYQEEETRLKWGFGTFDPNNDYLKIRTDILMELHGENEDFSLRFVFPGNQQGESPYFPYNYGAEWIALVVDDGLGNFMKIPLSQQEYTQIKERFPGTGSFPGQIRMRIRPLSVDAHKPLKLQEQEKLWLLRGDIAYLTLEVSPPEGTTQKPMSLYTYTAPWYLSSAESELLELMEK